MFGSQRRGRRLATAAIAAFASVTLLASCAGDGGGDNDAKDGETFVYAVGAVPDSLDFAPFGGLPTKIIMGVVDSTLVKYGDTCDTLNGSAGVQPNLAESWDVTEDSVTFHLSDAVSAYGNDLTAEDVKWSIERAMDVDVSARANLGTIGSYDVDNLFEIIDEKTIKLNLVDRAVFDVAQFASPIVSIRDSQEAKKHATDDDPWALDWAKTHTFDFGPWKLDRYTPGTEVTFVPNPNYHDERGNITSLVIKSVPESSTRTQLLASGDVSWADGLTFSEYAQLEDEKGVAVENCVSANRDDLFLQQGSEFFGDVKVRQAVSHAINRDQIVESVYRGYAQAAKSGVPQAYELPGLDQTYTYDPDQAKALLSEAGYPDGFSFTALFSPARPAPYIEQVAVQIQKDLAAVGIDMKLERVTGASEYFQTVVKGNFDAAFYSESTFVGDPAYGAATFALSTSAINSFGYKSSTYDNAVAEAQAATESKDEFNKKIVRVAEIGVEEIPMIYVADTANVQAHRDNVTGFQNNSLGVLHPAQLSIK